MKRDLEKYLASLQKQLNEMQGAVDEANKLIMEGKLSEEQTAAVQGYYNNILVNYQRALYCRYLYKLPPKFIQNIQKKKLEKELKKFVEENADDKSVIEENQAGIDATKEIVGEKDE